MISFWSLFVLAVIITCGVLLGIGVYAFNTGIEHRRTAAGIIATTLARFGLLKLAEIFRLYSVGDYSGFIIAMIDLSKELFASPTAFLSELEGAFNHMLDAKLADPKELLWLTQKVNAANLTKAAA